MNIKESKKKIGKGSLLGDSIILTFVRIVTVLVNLGQTMILAHQLDKVSYGTYAQLLTIITLTSSIAMLGLSDAVNYFYNKSQDLREKQKYVNTVLCIAMLFGVFIGVVILLTGPLMTQYYDNPYLQGLYIYIALRPMLANIIAIFQVLYISNGMARLIGIRNLFISVAQIGIVFFVTLFLKDIKFIFLCLLILDLIQLVIFALYFHKNCISIQLFKIDLHIIKPLLVYSIPMALSITMNSILRDMDKILIGGMCSVEDVALYAVASRSLPFYILTSSFTAIIVPYVTRFVAQKDFTKTRELLRAYYSFGSITTWILGAGAIVCAQELMRFLYSAKYTEGVFIFMVYILVDCVKFAYYGLLLSVNGKTKWLLFYSALTLAMNLVLNIVLLQWLGLIGPALATLITLVFTSLLQLKHGAKLIRTSVNKLFGFRKTLFFLLELCAVGVLCYFLKLGLLQMQLNETFIMVLVYVVFIVITGVLKRKDLTKCIRFLSSVR